MSTYSMLVVYTLLAILAQELWELIIDMIGRKYHDLSSHTKESLDHVTVFVQIAVPYVIAATCCVT